MNKGYEAMRGFWLEVKNLQHKKDVPALGDAGICVAGVEMAAADDKGQIKNLFIAASSLGNASVYFENNSPSGLGGFTGGTSDGVVKEKALLLVEAAAGAAAHLKPVDTLAVQTNTQHVTLFAVSKDGKLYAADVEETEVRKPENLLYPFFAYTQQLFGAFRAEQEKAAQTAASAGQPSDKK